MTKPDIVLGYCHRPNIPHTFLESIIDIQKADIGITKIIHQSTFYIPAGRNLVVKEFLETGSEWLLFVDDDILFTHKEILELFKYADKDKAPIVGGLYFGRLGGATEVILPVWLMFEKGGTFTSIKEFTGEALQKVDVLGMGFTLIHRSVFERIGIAMGRDDDWLWFGHDLRDGKRMGEDVTFCMRAADCGFPIYGCTAVTLGHLKTHIYDAKMFLAQEIMKPKT